MSVLFNLIRNIFGGAFILSYKNPSTSHRRLSLQLLINGGQQTSKQYKFFLLPLAAINQSRTRWLKTPHTLDRGLRGMQIVLTRTLLPEEQFSEYEQELCKLPREKSNEELYTAVLPAKYSNEWKIF